MLHNARVPGDERFSKAHGDRWERRVLDAFFCQRLCIFLVGHEDDGGQDFDPREVNAALAKWSDAHREEFLEKWINRNELEVIAMDGRQKTNRARYYLNINFTGSILY